MNRLLAVLFWSVIAAAFIGPGTVTTAASAGADHRFALLWALGFSTVACLVLQESAARLTIVSGRNLGQALRDLHPRGWRRAAILLLVLGAVVLGCAAYEAGNILGGVAGLRMALGLPPGVATLLSGLVATLLLWTNRPRGVAKLLSVLVALMGAAFLGTAVALRPPVLEILRGGLVPTVPPGAGILVLGLVGTTVVPYNLFLGSGIAGGEKLGETRFGLAVAVLLGGLISAGVLVVGSAVTPPFAFEELGKVLWDRLGGWGAGLFAAGLAAAGLSSAITAPLAAAVTARSLFAEPGDRRGIWDSGSWRYRSVWLGVVAVGVGFGLSGVRPVPAIILAQALNGILLPLATAFLLLAVNDRAQMGERGLNGPLSNGLMFVVLFATLLLGAANLLRAGSGADGGAFPAAWFLVPAMAVAGLLTAYVLTLVRRRRRG